MVLHVTIYPVLGLELSFATLGADIAKRPSITIGFTAFLVLIPLAVTSTTGMMHRLGRRRSTGDSRHIDVPMWSEPTSI